MSDKYEIIHRIRTKLMHPKYEEAMILWLEHLATDEDFLLNSHPTDESKDTILQALNMVSKQVFHGQEYVINSLSLRKNPDYNIIHGGGFIHHANFVLFFFPDLEAGCLLLNANRTYYIRISNLDDPPKPTSASPDNSQWN